MRFYLGGPINGCTDDEAHGWRDEVKALLDGAGHDWRDPMARDYRGRELEPGIAQEIVDGDLEDIRQCDVGLFNCPKPSWGTAMEIHFMARWMPSTQVIVVLPDGVDPSPWLLHYADLVTHGSTVDVLRSLLPSVPLWD